MPFYRDKLHEKGVYDRFGEILGKARQNRFAKDLTTELNDFEEVGRVGDLEKSETLTDSPPFFLE